MDKRALRWLMVALGAGAVALSGCSSAVDTTADPGRVAVVAIEVRPGTTPPPPPPEEDLD